MALRSTDRAERRPRASRVAPARPVHPHAPGMHRRPGPERGAALVEFAFIALMLSTLIFTTIDYGRFAQLQNRLSNAAREGSAYAQLQPCDTDGIKDRVGGQDPELTKVQGYDVDVTYRDDSDSDPSDACDQSPGDRVIVEVTAQVAMISPFAAAIVGDDPAVTRRVEAVIQG